MGRSIDCMVMLIYYLNQFLEVTCRSSGKKTRYAAGTKSSFAVNLINRKLDLGTPLALHIEAVKEDEEPVNFGPDAVLVDYGTGWKLQTVTEVNYAGKVYFFELEIFSPPFLCYCWLNV